MTSYTGEVRREQWLGLQAATAQLCHLCWSLASSLGEVYFLEDKQYSSDAGEDEEGVGSDGLPHGGERHADEEVPSPVGQGTPRHARRTGTHLEYLRGNKVRNGSEAEPVD